MAAQLTATQGPFARSLSLWMDCTNNSLPVPVSPVSNMLLSTCAKRLAVWMAERMAGLDDAGMDGADRDLVDLFALDAVEVAHGGQDRLIGGTVPGVAPGP